MSCNCGYWWADLNKDGIPITNEYCHYVGPEDWAPCMQDDYYDEDEEYEQYYADTLEAMSDPVFEEYGAPYDYGDDYYIG